MGLTEADAKALVNEGVLSADYDEHEEAIEFYDKALKIIETAETYLNKGISLVELEKYDDALSSYEKAIQVSPGYADAWYNKAELLKHKGQNDEAETCFAKVKELEGE